MSTEPHNANASMPASAPAPGTDGYDCPGNYIASAPTTLKCAKCQRPLMVKDARSTPTGYVCPYFVKSRVATFYNAGVPAHVGVGAIALVAGIVCGWLLSLVAGIGFFALILITLVGPALGGGVAEIVRRAFKKTRGQYFWLVAAICVVIGALPFVGLPVVFGLLAGSLGSIWGLIPVLGLVMLVGAMIARMRI
jgi:hypothetical protein